MQFKQIILLVTLYWMLISVIFLQETEIGVGTEKAVIKMAYVQTVTLQIS